MDATAPDLAADEPSITDEEAETARRFQAWRDDHPRITNPLHAWRQFTADAETAV